MTFLHPAAADLFDRHHRALLRFFRRLTGEAALAEDLTQEVFVRVVRGLAQYEPRGQEAAWVFQIARHVLADHRRKPPGHGVSLEEREARAAAGPATQVVAFGLQEALERLPDAERLAFLLREVAGLSYAEIAAVCDTTEDGVSARLYRARAQLRRLLSGRLSWRSMVRDERGTL